MGSAQRRRPVAVARYAAAGLRFTETPPAELQPALPELPALARELSSILETASLA